ncbi:hypothetical protein NDU88_009598 [Pleurodeles waltl]|uniref:Uncharacterized protein n=1 Tax=Pleurodeles waltl TaxID=8319 RepID=A0AAV7PVP2_PLEWA|nr:hypothetical protein NDU88_009598 [Pleurodeles waltl]
MQNLAELRCCRVTSQGRNDITGPQALQWHQIVTDVGRTTLRCQRSRAGSAVAVTRGLQGHRTSTRFTALGHAALRVQGSGVSSQVRRIRSQ